MVIAQPAPFVSAFVDAVDQAIREHNPSHGMSAIQRAWLAFCVTAILVTHSICWARFERASLGTYSLAALSWMVRHSKIPWDDLLVASVGVILRHYGLTCGSLVIDDSDNKRFTPYFGDSRKRSTVCGACPPSRREHVLPSRESLASLVCTTSARMARLWASAPCLLSRLMAGTPGVLTRHT
jgi:hypothetical protein